MKKILIAVILSWFLVLSALTDNTRNDLNGEILPVTAEAVGTDQVRIYYNIDHLPDGKYLAFASAGNAEGDWSEWSESLEFYRGVPTPQSINLFCGVSEATIPVRISQDNWNVYFCSSEEIVKTNKPATNAIDGDMKSLWISDWAELYPHEVQIDFGKLYNISKLYYLPRQDSYKIGLIKEYEIYASVDGKSWGKVISGEFPNSNDEQTIEFDEQAARYISLVALSDNYGTRKACIAEINILGY